MQGSLPRVFRSTSSARSACARPASAAARSRAKCPAGAARVRRPGTGLLPRAHPRRAPASVPITGRGEEGSSSGSGGAPAVGFADRLSLLVQALEQGAERAQRILAPPPPGFPPGAHRGSLAAQPRPAAQAPPPFPHPPPLPHPQARVVTSRCACCLTRCAFWRSRSTSTATWWGCCWAAIESCSSQTQLPLGRRAPSGAAGRQAAGSAGRAADPALRGLPLRSAEKKGGERQYS